MPRRRTGVRRASTTSAQKVRRCRTGGNRRLPPRPQRSWGLLAILVATHRGGGCVGSRVAAPAALRRRGELQAAGRRSCAAQLAARPSEHQRVTQQHWSTREVSHTCLTNQFCCVRPLLRVVHAVSSCLCVFQFGHNGSRRWGVAPVSEHTAWHSKCGLRRHSMPLRYSVANLPPVERLDAIGAARDGGAFHSTFCSSRATEIATFERLLHTSPSAGTSRLLHLMLRTSRCRSRCHRPRHRA